MVNVKTKLVGMLDEFIASQAKRPTGPNRRVAAHDPDQVDALRAIIYEHERHQQALDVHAIVSVADAAGNIIEVNDKFCQVSGYSREELLGNNHRIIKSGEHPPGLYAELWDTISSGRNWEGEICNRAKDGHLYWVETSIVPFLDENGLPYQYISIRTDITHIKTVEAELIAAKDAAESASRAKSEFLASMSHELRTPLNAILGFSQLFTLNTRLPLETRENAQEIERAGQHLLSLVNDLIDLARIEAGKLELSFEPVSVSTVVRDSLTMTAALAQYKNIKVIAAAVSDDEITVRADYVRLRQVVINLLSNAIKYNKPQGTVRITSQLNNGLARISVADTGPGIPIGKQSRIFSSFDRLGEELGEVEGTGIGLVITKCVIEALGGSIGFESIEGQGSTFWVDLPLMAPVKAHAPEQIATSRTAGTTGAQASRPVILYIEDNPTNMRLMQQIIGTRKNLELRSTDNAETGIELAQTQSPALILMDINLPGMDGYKALSILKADARTAHIPVIAVSANAMVGDKERGSRAGFTDYLTKPLDIVRFLAVLDEVLAA